MPSSMLLSPWWYGSKMEGETASQSGTRRFGGVPCTAACSAAIRISRFMLSWVSGEKAKLLTPEAVDGEVTCFLHVLGALSLSPPVPNVSSICFPILRFLGIHGSKMEGETASQSGTRRLGGVRCRDACSAAIRSSRFMISWVSGEKAKLVTSEEVDDGEVTCFLHDLGGV